MDYVCASYLEIKSSNFGFLGPEWSKMHKSTCNQRPLKLSKICMSSAYHVSEYWKSQVIMSCDMNNRDHTSVVFKLI